MAIGICYTVVSRFILLNNIDGLSSIEIDGLSSIRNDGFSIIGNDGLNLWIGLTMIFFVNNDWRTRGFKIGD